MNNNNTFLFTILAIATLTISLIAMPSVVNAKQSGLTIILKLKYSKLADSHPVLTLVPFFCEFPPVFWSGVFSL